ncbi:50S ribosomal protein L25, partial [Dokdonella sp.]|uniref:50S ribosomal protein L25 n=1 Tax=Dokdonella sp. TaxID=2291710 RepID=UPI003C35FE43
QKVLLKDMQRHPYKQQILHLDFLRINENEEIRVRVPLHFLNQDTSPAGKTAGVIIMHEVTEVEIACLPKDLPEYIEVDLAGLKVDDIIHLSSLKLPTGAQIPELSLGKEHDITVVSAKLGREEVDVAADDAAEGEEASGDKKDAAGDNSK